MGTLHAESRTTRVTQGLRANLGQFALLVLVNAFVGGMVGVERELLPLLAQREFHLAEKTAILSFIASFGVAKAITNLIAGAASDRVGRKPLLVLGWVIGLPVPLLLMWAPTWKWVTVANVLLGINQGLCWSVAVIMKIDLVGPHRRGLALGLNEFSGYVAVALVALGAGGLAARYGLRPEPFYLGLACAVLGLFLSVFLVKDTRAHVLGEAGDARRLPLLELLARGSGKDRTLSLISQAGLVNNLNDGMAWGLFPLFFLAQGLDVAHIAWLVAATPLMWGAGQLFTGALSDRVGRKWLIVLGMWQQALAITLMVFHHGFVPWLLSAALLGLGTAFTYPTLLAAVGDVAPPASRASMVGVYRFWRDLGYAVGALASGLIADAFGLSAAILSVAALTFVSGTVCATSLPETKPATRS